jgi:hypothetical protein
MSALRYFQIYREWEIDQAGVVPKLGRELSKCAFSAISISSRKTFEDVGHAIGIDLTGATVGPRSRDRLFANSEMFIKPPWTFEISINDNFSAIFIFARFHYSSDRNLKDQTLDKIVDIDREFARRNLESKEIDSSYLWNFQKVNGDENFFD